MDQPSIYLQYSPRLNPIPQTPGDGCGEAVPDSVGPLPREQQAATRGTLYTLHPAPYTLHPSPCILHPTPYTLHPSPYTLLCAPYTLHPTPYTLHHTPYTLHLTPYTLHPTSYTLTRFLLSQSRQRSRHTPKCRSTPPTLRARMHHNRFTHRGG